VIRFAHLTTFRYFFYKSVAFPSFAKRNLRSSARFARFFCFTSPKGKVIRFAQNTSGQAHEKRARSSLRESEARFSRFTKGDANHQRCRFSLRECERPSVIRFSLCTRGARKRETPLLKRGETISYILVSLLLPFLNNGKNRPVGTPFPLHNIEEKDWISTSRFTRDVASHSRSLLTRGARSSHHRR
jgi:hypothetical protein